MAYFVGTMELFGHQRQLQFNVKVEIHVKRAKNQKQKKTKFYEKRKIITEVKWQSRN